MVFPYLTVEETECAEERHQPRSEAPGECWPDWDPQPRCTLLLGTDVSRRLLDRTMTREMPNPNLWTLNIHLTGKIVFLDVGKGLQLGRFS